MTWQNIFSQSKEKNVSLQKIHAMWMSEKIKVLFCGCDAKPRESKRLAIAIFSTMVFAAGIVTFDEVIAERFLLPICDFCKMKDSCWTGVFASFLSVGAMVLGWNFAKRYVETKYYCAFVLCLFCYLYYKLSDVYFIFMGFWQGFDYWSMVFSGLAGGFIAYRVYKRGHESIEDEKGKHVVLFEDNPIENASMDILGFENYAKKIANTIIHYNFDKSFSIGIVSPWGSGKSSMLKLIENHIKEKNVVLVWFNPRQSFDAMSIQKDFLSLLCENMKKYHSGLNGLMRRYMKDLDVISSDTIWAKVFGLVHIDDIEKSRGKIEHAIERINKKIVVFIDDFDRLTGAEIMEVLKLIDQNASFRKTFFVTAYDKKHVNMVLNSHMGKNGSDSYSRDFTDKFFNLELQLPAKPSYYKNSFLLKQLLAISKEGIIKDRRDVIEQAFLGMLDFIDVYLPTIRDVKRYLNLLLASYVEVQDDVVLSDYLLITLIKYGCREEYYQLRSKELLNINNLYDINDIVLHLKDSEQYKGVHCYPLLKQLFPESNGVLGGQEYLLDPHVCKKNSFDTYFFDILEGRLYKKELNMLWHPKSLTSNEFKVISEKWNTPQQIEDVRDYVTMKEHVVKDRQSLEMYLKLVSLSYGILGMHDLYFIASKYFFNYNEGIKRILNLNFNDENEYRKWLFNLMSKQNDMFVFNKLLAKILTVLLSDTSSQNQCYLTIQEIQKIIIESFVKKLRIIKGEKTEIDDLCSLFLSCIREVNQYGKVTYMEEAVKAFKDKMLKQPMLFYRYLVVHEDVSDKRARFKFGLPIEILFPGDDFEFFLEKLDTQYQGDPTFIRSFWEEYKKNKYSPFIKEKRVRGMIALGNYQQYLQVLQGDR